MRSKRNGHGESLRWALLLLGVSVASGGDEDRLRVASKARDEALAAFEATFGSIGHQPIPVQIGPGLSMDEHWRAYRGETTVLQRLGLLPEKDPERDEPYWGGHYDFYLIPPPGKDDHGEPGSSESSWFEQSIPEIVWHEAAHAYQDPTSGIMDHSDAA